MADRRSADLENRISELEADIKRRFPTTLVFDHIGNATAGDADALCARIRTLERYIDVRTRVSAIIARQLARQLKIEAEREKFRRRWVQVQAENTPVYRRAIDGVRTLFNTRGRP